MPKKIHLKKKLPPFIKYRQTANFIVVFLILGIGIDLIADLLQSKLLFRISTVVLLIMIASGFLLNYHNLKVHQRLKHRYERGK